MSKHIFKLGFIFVFGLLFQLLLGRYLVLFGVAFCFPYLLFLLLLPVDISMVRALFLAFLTGLIIDMIYNTGGIHAGASVLMVFIRGWWLNSITPQGGYDNDTIPSLSIGGFTWILGYILPLIFVHHIFLFFVESYGFSFFWSTLNKAFFSSIFTFTLCIIGLILSGRNSS